MLSGYTFTKTEAKQFNQQVRSQANSWDVGLELGAPSGKRPAYLSASEHLCRMLLPLMPMRVQNRGVALQSGLSVAACYTHTLANVALQHNLEQTELVDLARGPLTVGTLLLPAATERRIAISIEDLAGMRPTDWHSAIKKVAQYSIDPRGIHLANAFNTIDYATYYGNNDVEDSDKLPAGKCPAPAAGMISPLFDAMLTVADTDPRLFAATLTQGTIE